MKSILSENSLKNLYSFFALTPTPIKTFESYANCERKISGADLLLTLVPTEKGKKNKNKGKSNHSGARKIKMSYSL